ncbi:hypothetical protein DKM44_02190 [Deinococcus irradiatisoli]|uniref:Uncharacterized protein n=1 Tax=Deinococcus irradiatisoli TaxID=2202254 RepID=A0A2Z3JGX8_9DEIO|nr:hypothetical protein [Deinococcus irradiatisoli]AWN22189.1 hypothetical protein DKM44_02190 [Deinococcus irradiatisoli]
MPFSNEQFAACWTVLEDRFNRKHNTQTVQIYREILSEQLSAEQFGAACRAAFQFETFFPSPQKLIEYGHGGRSFQARALERWDAMIERVRAGESATDDKEERRLLMRATNGISLGMVEVDQLHWAQRAWVERYTEELTKAAQASIPALPGTVLGVLDAAD